MPKSRYKNTSSVLQIEVTTSLSDQNNWHLHIL